MTEEAMEKIMNRTPATGLGPAIDIFSAQQQMFAACVKVSLAQQCALLRMHPFFWHVV